MLRPPGGSAEATMAVVTACRTGWTRCRWIAERIGRTPIRWAGMLAAARHADAWLRDTGALAASWRTAHCRHGLPGG